MRVYATLELENIVAELSGTATQCDYGVPRSPTWVEIEDMAIESLEILGRDVSPKALPQGVLTEIYSAADEWLEESDWQAIE